MKVGRAQNEREDTRSRLLEATVECIQHKGRGATTARAIAEAADANLAAIVYHFGSKDELVEEALIVLCERWTDFLLDTGFAAPDGGNLAERIAAAVGEFVGALGRNRALVAGLLEALATADRSPTLRATLASYYEELREAASGDAGDLLGGVAAGAFATAIVGLFHGLAIQWVVDPDELIESLRSILDLPSP